jgi:hypothetical protein
LVAAHLKIKVSWAVQDVAQVKCRTPAAAVHMLHACQGVSNCLYASWIMALIHSWSPAAVWCNASAGKLELTDSARFVLLLLW